MISIQLHEFAERTLDAGAISYEDFLHLAREILPDGPATREEADVLIALDRTVAPVHEGWSNWFIATLTDFCVWKARPTGRVEEQAAQWLVTSLSCGEGPTENACRLALDIVREAQWSHDALMRFALANRHRHQRAATVIPAPAPVETRTQALEAAL